jgi:hypothetical protein
MPGKLVPTPVTDKNGKQTTVHKKSGVSVGNNRVAAVGNPAKDKRIKIANPYGSEKIEVGAIAGSDSQKIYLDGLAIGSVEKQEVNINVGGGKRNYVVKTNRTNRWFSTIHDADSDVVGEATQSFSNGDTTRISAVQSYVRGYYSNLAEKKIADEFAERGGEAFKGKYDSTITFRDREFKVKGQYALGSSLGYGRHVPQNKLNVYSNLGSYVIVLDGENSTVSFTQDRGREPAIVFPLDAVNGIIEDPAYENDTFHTTLKTNESMLFSHAQGTLHQMFG